MDENEENVAPQMKCWQCHFVIPESQLHSLDTHSCFNDFNEKCHVINLSADGTVFMRMLTKKEIKYAKEERLLNSLKLYPALFDSKERTKFSLSDRQKMWDALSNSVPDYTADTARKEWKNLRDQYRKMDDPTSFRHFEEMQFFDNYSTDVGNRQPDQPIQGTYFFANTPNNRVEELDERNFENDESTSHHETANYEPEENNPSTSTEPPTRGVKRKSSKENKTPELQQLILEKISSHNFQKPDPVDLVLMTLGRMFRQLEDKRQRRVHRQFLQILDDELNDQDDERVRGRE